VVVSAFLLLGLVHIFSVDPSSQFLHRMVLVVLLRRASLRFGGHPTDDCTRSNKERRYIPCD
jgi:hypothetical protein